ncbi:hypothetical protein LTR94_024410 [Friedmanniomyces endolithicus]|nr:hypothetical protein LTR94_024410 [Friedmanniomyces endolithicus]
MSPALSEPIRVAVLISGAGSNMAALVERAEAPGAAYEVALVLSNIAGAAGLELASNKGIATALIEHRGFGKDRLAHERAIDEALRSAGIQVVALAGYMRVLTPWLVQAWQGRMINIHPSLLPLHPGLDTHARAIAAGDAEAGCSVHIVTEGVDEGPILGQARVDISDNETPESLAQKVKAVEHNLYPEVLSRFCQALSVEA